MNEQQARYVRKLKVEQHCSFMTVARLFYDEFGDNPYCNKNNAESVMYFDNDVKSDTVKFHKFSDGKIPSKNYQVNGYTFSEAVGKKLCNTAMKVFKENYSDGWGDFDHKYMEEAG